MGFVQQDQVAMVDAHQAQKALAKENSDREDEAHKAEMAKLAKDIEEQKMNLHVSRKERMTCMSSWRTKRVPCKMTLRSIKKPLRGWKQRSERTLSNLKRQKRTANRQKPEMKTN